MSGRRNDSPHHDFKSEKGGSSENDEDSQDGESVRVAGTSFGIDDAGADGNEASDPHQSRDDHDIMGAVEHGGSKMEIWEEELDEGIRDTLVMLHPACSARCCCLTPYTL